MLLVRFTHLDPSDESRDFSIVVDVSDPVYKGAGLFRNVPSHLMVYVHSTDILTDDTYLAAPSC